MIPDNVKTIIDLIIGDGWIGRVSKNGARLRIEHSIKQLEYAKHKEFMLNKIGIETRSGEITYKGRSYYRIDSLTYPEIKTAHKWLYNKNKKAVDKSLLKQLDAKSLAYWFMDDGYSKSVKRLKKGDRTYIYAKPATHHYGLCTDCFSEEENNFIADWLYNTFGIISKVCRQKQYHRNIIYAFDDKNKFKSIIEPYIIPSLVYKIEKPHTLKDIPFTVVNIFDNSVSLDSVAA